MPEGIAAMKNDSLFTLNDALALLVITIASIIGINQYTYGLYNHFITIPFIKSIIDPNLYPNDYLIAEKKYFYTFFNSGCAMLVKTFHISLPQLFFSLYCISLYASLYAYFKIAITLYPKKEVAYFSVVFLIFSFTTLGEVRTIESLFLERTFVLPFLLFAFYFFLRKKIVWAYALSGFAFLFHPLSAAYMLACLFVCSLLSFKEIGWKNLAIGFIMLILLISPVLYLKVKHPAPSLGFFHADPQWLELLRLRSSHHLFPSGWSPLLLVQSALFIAGFGLCRIHKPQSWHYKAVMLSAGAVLLMCVMGTIFTELYPLSIVLQFQLFRSFVFLIFFAIIFYSNFFFEESKNRNALLQKVMVFICFAGIFYNGNFSKYASFLLVALAIFPGYAIVNHYKKKLSVYYFPLLISVVFLLGIAGTILKGGFTIHNKQDGDWLAVQEWANKNTPKDALFIVSPKSEGFRVESERSCYGDWKDGTQMFFNPSFGQEWFRRMKMLGYVEDDKLQQTYEALKEEDFAKIKTEAVAKHSAVYVIGPGRRLTYQKVYEGNGKFDVYRMP